MNGFLGLFAIIGALYSFSSVMNFLFNKAVGAADDGSSFPPVHQSAPPATCAHQCTLDQWIPADEEEDSAPLPEPVVWNELDHAKAEATPTGFDPRIKANCSNCAHEIAFSRLILHANHEEGAADIRTVCTFCSNEIVIQDYMAQIPTFRIVKGAIHAPMHIDEMHFHEKGIAAHIAEIEGGEEE